MASGDHNPIAYPSDYGWPEWLSILLRLGYEGVAGAGKWWHSRPISGQQCKRLAFLCTACNAQLHSNCLV